MTFSGSYVALITPWTDDLSAIDHGAVKELVEWQIESGTDGILPAGTTGESPTLSHKEQGELIANVVKFAKGRCKIMAGAGSNSTAESISLAKAAKDAGADSILVITPYYNRPTPEGLYRHFEAVTKACDLPLMIYNIPGRTGVNMLPETVARVAKAFPSVRGIKEASGSVDQASQIIAMTDLDVLSGDDSLALPLMSVGGSGVVSVIANVVPAETRKMMADALAGDFAKAREMHHRLLPFMKACFIETNPGPVKAAMRILGKSNGKLRLPMAEARPETEQALREAMRKAGIGG